MPAPPLIRLGSSCCKHLLKKCSFNNNLLLRCQLSVVRSLAYTTTCATQQVSSEDSSSSSDTNVLFRHPIEKLKLGGKINNVTSEAMEQLKRERRSTLLFMTQLKESGYKHDLETYMSVVRLLSHWDWRMDAESNKLLNDVIDNTNWEVVSFEISDQLLQVLVEEKLIKAVEALVEVYATAGRFDEAVHTLSEMKIRSGLMASTGTCNFVLHKLNKLEKEDMVESVYKELKRIGLIPNVWTYMNLMRAICRKGCLDETWKVIEEMEEVGVKPNSYIYSTYINGLCKKGKTDLAFKVLKNLKESNKPVDWLAYASVIHGFVKESKLQDAEDVFLDMKLRQVVPNAHCYGALIMGYCRKGDTDKALDILKKMEEAGVEPSALIYSMYILGLSCKGKTDLAFQVLKNLRESNKPVNVIAYASIINGFVKESKLQDAEDVFLDMKLRQVVPDAHCYSALMIGYCQKGDIDKALDIFKKMEEAGIEPSALIYSTYIHGLSCKGKTDLAFQVLKNFRESNKPVNVIAYASVINGFVKESRLQDAEDVFLDMKLRQVVPNAHCYISLIMGYCGKGDIDKALDLFKDMESRGIKTDHVFVRRMVQYLSDLGMLGETVCLFKHFTQQSKGVFLDGVSFNIAIDAACKLGKLDDAIGFLEVMKARKIKPLVMQAQGFQGQRVQPNVGPDVGVQSEGVGCDDGVVQDARDEAAVGQLHTTQQTPALHKLTSLNAHHYAMILKKFRKSKRR